MISLGYDPTFTSADYVGGTPAELGNFIAAELQAFGMSDGSNMANDHNNQYFDEANPDMYTEDPGNPTMVDPNKWQPLTVEAFIDQNGNPLPNSPEALGVEWGNVVPFSCTDEQKTVTVDGDDTWVTYFDNNVGPPQLDVNEPSGLDSFFKWGHLMVPVWQSHLDPSDGVYIDASPLSMGNVDPADFPHTLEEYQAFYNFYDGNTYADQGHALNPYTNLPYEPQMVPRGDFSRVLAEFWADGPNSETPPGHWFTLLNYVSDHPAFEKKWGGNGPILDDLEWDVRSYFAMGGGMHDAAICAWGLKGRYNSVRPISAIRWMGDQGQCTDSNLPHYSPAGLPLIPGYVELVQAGDPLAGPNNENQNKIKLYTWKGHEFINDPNEDVAGVGWVLAENWWPYQRPTFVTPPFPGYISGHSTYSRTAAELMNYITGDEYFPGGLGVFNADQNEYLVFEDGPSIGFELRWATYEDAANQSGLSRIWGGIHPPFDDIPGREMGIILGEQVFDHAEQFMNADMPKVVSLVVSDILINDSDNGSDFMITITYDRNMNQSEVPQLLFPFDQPSASLMLMNSGWENAQTYVLEYMVDDVNITQNNIDLQVKSALDISGFEQDVYYADNVFSIDTENPMVSEVADLNTINDLMLQAQLEIEFSEEMDANSNPSIVFPNEDPSNTLVFNAGQSSWISTTVYNAIFDVVDANVVWNDIDYEVSGAMDSHGNNQILYSINDAIDIDTENPTVSLISPVDVLITDADAGTNVIASVTFVEPMNTTVSPQIEITGGLNATFTFVSGTWSNINTYDVTYSVSDVNVDIDAPEFTVSGAQDAAGNTQNEFTSTDVFSVDTQNPIVSSIELNENILSDQELGSNGFVVSIDFNETMNTSIVPIITFSEDVTTSLQLDAGASQWIDDQIFEAVYTVLDAGIEIAGIEITAAMGEDASGNTQSVDYISSETFDIDTRNPEVIVISANTYNITTEFSGTESFSIISLYDEEMDIQSTPLVNFPVENPSASLSFQNGPSDWISSNAFESKFNVAADLPTLLDIDVVVTNARDEAGNTSTPLEYANFFDINAIVSIVESNLSNDVLVYPNPVNSSREVVISWKELIAVNQIRIFNSVGQELSNIQINRSGNSSVVIPTENMSSGMYFAKLVSGDKEVVVNFQVN
jgi:hypothetical protein